MNNLETIQYLAQAEAKHHTPLSEEIEGIPFLKIEKQHRNYQVTINNHEGHDNEGRGQFIAEFVKTILRDIDPSLNASGIYPIELHDSYAYLDRPREKYDGVLTFSKNMSHAQPILLPDPFQISSYGGMLGFEDPYAFQSKQDVIVFAGTTTGDRNAKQNCRINACLWALDKRPSYQFYITNIAQMSEKDVPQSILHAPLTIDDQLKCKYIFNIQGNTCCWSRVPMVLNSKSLLINLKHDDGTWYYPLLQDSTHMVTVPNLNALPATLQYCANNAGLCELMTHNANVFVKNYCGYIHAAHYAKSLFETLAMNNI